MKTRPIIFSGDSVKAILEGRKIQTRRVIRPQPESVAGGWFYQGYIFTSDESMQSYLFHNVYGNGGCRFGSVYSDGTADRLWVRETWAAIARYNSLKPSVLPKECKVWYTNGSRGLADPGAGTERGKTRPSIFMPRWASRITLEVVDVRVERVQNISAVNAMWEGIEKAHHPINKKTIEALGDKSATGLAVIEDFCLLWDSINAKRGYSWQSNPWVWVVDFKLLEA